jgi:hypothetical protein
MQRSELSPNDTIRLLTREPLLIVRLSILKPGLPNTMRLVKETLSRLYLCLAHSTWARWWRSWSSQVGLPFLIALAWWSLADCSPILHYGWETSRIIFTCPFPPNGHRTSSIWYLLDAYLELALRLDEHCTSSSSFIMMISWECTWEVTPSHSSRHILYSVVTSSVKDDDPCAFQC